MVTGRTARRITRAVRVNPASNRPGLLKQPEPPRAETGSFSRELIIQALLADIPGEISGRPENQEDDSRN